MNDKDGSGDIQVNVFLSYSLKSEIIAEQSFREKIVLW